MKISEIIRPAAISLDIASTDRREIIAALVGLLHSSATLADPDKAVQMVWQRECEAGSGIGLGVAIPHSDPADYPHPLLALGRLNSGADFPAPDGIPVRLVFLLLSPGAAPALHIRLMARLSRLMKSDDLRRRLLLAPTPMEAYQALADAEAGFPELVA